MSCFYATSYPLSGMLKYQGMKPTASRVGSNGLRPSTQVSALSNTSNYDFFAIMYFREPNYVYMVSR